MRRYLSSASDTPEGHQMQNAADKHGSVRKSYGNKLQKIYWSDYIKLQLIRKRLSRCTADMVTLIPAAKWLFENYHQLYLSLKAFQAAGAASRYRRLPVIASGPEKDFPRAYLVAREIIYANHYHVNEDQLIRLVSDYQRTLKLEQDEIDILPDILRFCILDRIIIEASLVLPAIESKLRADQIVDRHMDGLMSSEKNDLTAIKKELRVNDLRKFTFSSHLIYRLKSLCVTAPEIEQLFRDVLGENEAKAYISEITDNEKRFQTETEGVISALFESLKEVADVDIDRYISKVSTIERILSKDPSTAYVRMDSASRSYYRKQVVRYAKKFKHSQSETAELAVECAHNPPKNETYAAKNHVGCYLAGQGRHAFRERLAGRKLWCRSEEMKRILGHVIYFLGMAVTTVLILCAVMILAGYPPMNWPPEIMVLFLLMIIPSSSIGIYLMNTLMTHLVPPVVTPAMDYDDGIPATSKTFVVMPVIAASAKSVTTFSKALERHYISNRDEHLYFALLLDFKDADHRHLPDDAALVEAGVHATEALNKKYPSREARFFFFYREREWNEKQGCWMGWERKRGKLEEFNAMLLGDTSRFIMPVGDSRVFSGIRYIVTLDSDTELPKETAARLIGIMDHPLNRPVIDEDRRIVKSGYVIVQSEIRNRIPSPSSGVFQAVLSGRAGFDSYSTIVSDVYQDVFSEGIFVGKGIYDLRAFHNLMDKRIPENRVLSHDLLESCMTRCAFASGTKLVDKVPTRIDSFLRREHRWIRGDWQLLPYIFHRKEINVLSKWKIIDNIRRSLVHPAQFILIIANIIILPSALWIWPLFLFFEFALGGLLMLFGMISRKIGRVHERISASLLGRVIADYFFQAFYRFLLLPARALMCLDAIIRTLFRLAISHKNLLEWQTADALDREGKSSLANYFLMMWPAYIPAVMFAWSAIFAQNIAQLISGIALCALFMLSPIFARFSDRPMRSKHRERAKKQSEPILRQLAFRIWRYYVEQATQERHFMCPDHIQEQPGPKSADRTSPTNIGLHLLAAVSARDLGWISILELTDICEKIIHGVAQLPHWKGHLYNWYDIKTMQPIAPEYVSTVDSGNYFSSLLTLKHALQEAMKNPIFNVAMIKGMEDIKAYEIDKINYFDVESIRPKKHAEQKIKRKAEAISSDQMGDVARQFYDEVDMIREENKKSQVVSEYCEGIQRDYLFFGRRDPENMRESPLQLAEKGNHNSIEWIKRIRRLCEWIDRVIAKADFGALYDQKKRLFHIGYNISVQKLDRGHYDLLASESRTTSFLAIAKGDVGRRHWAALGRPLTLVRGIPAMVSWSGSMFEYLMPALVMRMMPGTLIEQSCRAAIISQRNYARKNKIPWGISESQYYIFDNHANYQYGPFGVGKMRLQPSLKPVRVVAPYATVLALMLSPKHAVNNIRKLIRMGAGGAYGLYEALDFNSPDALTLRKFSVVKSFMTHHLGMSIASINNFLSDNTLIDRFHSEPMIQAAELSLEETLHSPMVTIARIGYNIDLADKPMNKEVIESRIFDGYEENYPIAHVLSNGRYQLMMTQKGEGFSACDHKLINRWRPCRSEGGYGSFIYIRDTDANRIWSAGYYPVMAKPDEYKVVFAHDKIEFIRRDGDVSTRTEITISPIDMVEIRRVTLINHGERAIHLDLTAAFEPVIADLESDLVHPAYSKLFVKCEYIPEHHMLVASRRTKSPDEKAGSVWMMVSSDYAPLDNVRFETSRQRFLGRGGSVRSPDALRFGEYLAGMAGSSGDPVLALQLPISLAPGRSISARFVTAYCDNPREISAMAEKYAARQSDDDTFKVAHTAGLLEIEYLGIRSKQLEAIQNLVGALYYPTMAFKSDVLPYKNNVLGQSGLWKFGISGDRPIMLLRIADIREKETLIDVLLAFEFLRLQKIRVDLVILNESEGGYDDQLQQMIFEETATLKVYDRSLSKTGIFVLKSSRITSEERTLFMTVARIIFTAQTGIYFRNLTSRVVSKRNENVIALSSGAWNPVENAQNKSRHGEPVPEFFNGMGGFVRDGREYEIRLDPGTSTPSPWINVVANSQFGFQISEIGSGYTWSKNSRENKLTQWNNDPIQDPPSEAVYVRDRQTGAIMSPCSLTPVSSETYRVRHGFGYSMFTRPDDDLTLQMTVFVPENDPVKLILLTIENHTDLTASLSAAYYVQWVLGGFREHTAPYIVTDFDYNQSLLTAKNVFNPIDKQEVAYLFSSHDVTGFTGDRKSFIGVEGRPKYPVGLAYGRLKKKVGEGLDPCGVIVCDFDIAPHSSETIVFGLGQSRDNNSASIIANQYRDVEHAVGALGQVHQFWRKIPGGAIVRSPDRALDILMNGWVLYQVIACRLLARAAFYQCGGAYGFRDQLQDVLATLSVDSSWTREHILRCCSRQFKEGDVQHWWHENGVGVRTRISDDLLWLPYAVAEYISRTQDYSVLDETVPFLEDDLLENDQHERVSIAHESEERASVYHHCLLAIDYAAAFGEHGLPLMKGGDWNDGMNRVGIGGKGESVWLGWFMINVLRSFAPLCEKNDDQVLAERYRQTATDIQNAIERYAWDGDWYLRAYFDNGAPLGSSSNEECRIDSISQSWSVISGAGSEERITKSLMAVKSQLVDYAEGVVKLLYPPFDANKNHPGYIQAYLPGMRENGGQYTHAAIWLFKAFCMRGDAEEAYRLLNILNPIRATSDYRSVIRYQREPYVLCADIYGVYPDAGKGGWSWYTGAAGWFYRTVLQDFLGIDLRDDRLRIHPSVPNHFQRYQVEYLFGKTLYEIAVSKKSTPSGGADLEVSLDCEPVIGDSIKLVDDGVVHRIDVYICK
ncbi:MAG: hypothetical protein GXY06_02570 [Clostridiaceae bacterium]|nr:hypothetical protein [Clostridiaceae bacterium]